MADQETTDSKDVFNQTQLVSNQNKSIFNKPNEINSNKTAVEENLTIDR